jgi:hypothetical protein
MYDHFSFSGNAMIKNLSTQSNTMIISRTIYFQKYQSRVIHLMYFVYNYDLYEKNDEVSDPLH